MSCTSLLGGDELLALKNNEQYSKFVVLNIDISKKNGFNPATWHNKTITMGAYKVVLCSFLSYFRRTYGVYIYIIFF